MLSGPPLAEQVKVTDSPVLKVPLFGGTTITEPSGDTGGPKCIYYSIVIDDDISLTSESGIVGVCYCIDHRSSGHTTVDSIVTVLH